MSRLRIRDRDMAVGEEGVCVADSEPTQLYTVRFPYKEILLTIQLQVGVLPDGPSYILNVEGKRADIFSA